MLPANRTASPLASNWTGPANRLESVFDRFFGEDGWAAPAQALAPVSLWQDDDHFFVEMDLPGVAEGDVDITLHDGLLTIRSERKAEEGRKYLYNGRAFGRIERRIAIPGPVDSANVEAAMVGGVLRLTLPKSDEAKPKKITVRPA